MPYAPRDVVERLRIAMAKVMQTPDFIAEMAQVGAEVPADGLGSPGFPAEPADPVVA